MSDLDHALVAIKTWEDGYIDISATFDQTEGDALVAVVRRVVALHAEGGTRICTCQMAEGITWEDDKPGYPDGHMHNSNCDGLTEHRWVLVDRLLVEP